MSSPKKPLKQRRWRSHFPPPGLTHDDSHVPDYTPVEINRRFNEAKAAIRRRRIADLNRRDGWPPESGASA